MKDYQEYSLLRHNTFRIDSKCHRFLEYESIEEAVSTAEVLRSSKLPFLIVGGGSNLLLTKDFDGVVVHCGIKGIDGSCSPIVKVGAGEVFDDVVEYCVEHQLYGAENLSLIPGEVGASAVQNIGAYGSEAKDIIEKIYAVEIATGSRVEISNADCCYGYRNSRFKSEWRNKYLITHVSYLMSAFFSPKLDYGNIRTELGRKGIAEPSPRELRQTIIEIRREKLPDPEITGNAGSFFMNPVVGRDKYEQLSEQYPDMPHYYIDDSHEKIPAGWMIEQCGWKGRSLGPAGVHDRQALVLVNRGGAKGEDIVRLSDAIRHDVKAKFGIDIFPEVNII